MIFMANKKTQKVLFGELRELAVNAGNTELIEFCDKKIEQLDKKKATGMTAIQKANVGLKETIVEVLNSLDRAVTITEIQEVNEVLGELSNQKMSALLKQLVDSNIIIKTVIKKKSYFELA